jgi:hypothetical protein
MNLIPDDVRQEIEADASRYEAAVRILLAPLQGIVNGILDRFEPTVLGFLEQPAEISSEDMEDVTAAFLRPLGTTRWITPEEPPS